MHGNVVWPLRTTCRIECFSTLMRGCTMPLGSVTIMRPGYVEICISPAKTTSKSKRKSISSEPQLKTYVATATTIYTSANWSMPRGSATRVWLDLSARLLGKLMDAHKFIYIYMHMCIYIKCMFLIN